MSYKPEAETFLSSIDKGMLNNAGLEGSLNAGRVFLQRGLSILDFCEGKYKDAEAKVSTLTEEANKWKHYARVVYKTECPQFLDSALAFATAVKANQGLASVYDDTFAKLVQTRLTGE